jgi:hypothetical protein
MAIDPFDPQTLATLLAQFRATPHDELSKRWLLLESAHVVGQMRFLPHLRVHALMLHFAWRTRDWSEVVGQVMRLLLVPLGHAMGRLPIGNPGRSNISAFQPMPVRPDIAHAIALAREETQGI